MKTFDFRWAADIDDAVATATRTGGRYYAGGTNLLDLMKGGVENPDVLIDITRLGLDAIRPTGDGGVMIGAAATNSVVANHPLIRDRYPVLSQAVLSGATTQLRNMATVGGNLMQRTRCAYFMDLRFDACDKRVPGSGCGARAGLHREHAVFETSASSCVAVHPSDMAVALAMLDARIHVTGPNGARVLSIHDFHRLPGDRPHDDTTLEAAELIVAVELPRSPYAEHSWYLKVRDRHSYAFALVSVAVGLDLADGVVSSAAIALGGVAAKPWRCGAAEAALAGATPASTTFRTAAHLALAGAAPLAGNAFKVDLGKHAVVRALTLALPRA